ncbi:MAG: LAGLIDADG family homing endonuclease [bacterium]|nr:LAGLIDADG family homing endonuclease [bacterium]
MAKKWTKSEEDRYGSELRTLYISQNKTISEVGLILNIAPQTVFSRLHRLGIPTCREKKLFVNNQRKDIILPKTRSATLAELLGVLLGDGHISHFQVIITLGSKELKYAHHVSSLLKNVFGKKPKISVRSTGYRDVYLGSTAITSWLMREGLVSNKVEDQVDAPLWIFKKREYMIAFLRGFFDTDGSIYKLKYGIQLSFTNKSLPLLYSLQKMLRALGYAASAMSAYRVYVTRVSEVERFFREIKPANAKHQRRFSEFIRRVGTQAVNEDAL